MYALIHSVAVDFATRKYSRDVREKIDLHCYVNLEDVMGLIETPFRDVTPLALLGYRWCHFWKGIAVAFYVQIQAHVVPARFTRNHASCCSIKDGQLSLRSRGTGEKPPAPYLYVRLHEGGIENEQLGDLFLDHFLGGRWYLGAFRRHWVHDARSLFDYVKSHGNTTSALDDSDGAYIMRRPKPDG